MSHIDNHIRSIRDPSPGSSQDGFSLVEVIVATTVMLVVVGAVLSLVGGSLKVATATYEMTDAQQNLRTAHEFINRDLMNAGDGLKSIDAIRVPEPFMLSYITLTPVPACGAGICTLSIFTSDNNVPALTAITGAVPAANVRTNTDRQTILALDPEFNADKGGAISLLPAAPLPLPARPASINATGSTVTIPAVANGGPAMSIFNVGEVYFFNSGVGGVRAAFGTITAIDVGLRQLTFSAGDTYGLNNTGAAGHISFVSANGTASTSLQRMKIIQYYVTDSKLLMRRVFGIQGAGVRASIIAEHVLNVQFNYTLIVKDDTTGVVTPSQTMVLATSIQQLAVRQVEVTVTVETPHVIRNGSQPQLTMVTSTSVRNMQFRKAL
jgi:prepilin-type N-terminal cleavage/methylation domain-containing protein